MYQPDVYFFSLLVSIIFKFKDHFHSDKLILFALILGIVGGASNFLVKALNSWAMPSHGECGILHQPITEETVAVALADIIPVRMPRLTYASVGDFFLSMSTTLAISGLLRRFLINGYRFLRKQ